MRNVKQEIGSLHEAQPFISHEAFVVENNHELDFYA